MGLLKIALLQIVPCDTLQGNLEKGMEYCKRAGTLGADIALFPEMWSNGYNIYNRPWRSGQRKQLPLTVILSIHSGSLPENKTWLLA